MFEYIRQHTRLTLGFLLLLIIPAFVFVGVEGYSRFTDGSGTAVATVDGRGISRGEWENVHQRNVDRVRRERPELDSRALDTLELRRETLDAMIRERVLLTAASRMHLSPSDARLQRLFVSDPQFASMRNPDGSVNRDILAMQGMNSEIFAQRLRQEFAMQQVLAGVTRTALATPAVASASLDPLLQRRELQLQRFSPEDYRSRVTPSEQEIEAFYKAQEAQFRAPEQAQIEYVVLDLESLAREVTPSDDDIERFYRENATRFTTPEERRASHILITASREQPAPERAQARDKAQALLAQVRAQPTAFAELARANSQDPGSAQQGGDLDFFARGAMVKPFEDAAFSLKPGEVSEVIETDFGFHVIQLTDVRGGQKKPLPEVRGEIAEELRRSQAQRRWAELAEQFTNTVYEQSDSLQPAVDRLKLQVLTATVQRSPAPGGSGPLASARFLDALFSDDSIVNKRNTDAVEFGPNQLVSGRVVQHSPARVLPLAEVLPAVRERLVAEQSARLAADEGRARLAELKSNPQQPLSGSAAVTLSRFETLGLPREVVDTVLAVDASALPAAAGVDLGEQGYVLVRVTQVLPREAMPEAEASLRDQYAQAWAAAEAEAYLGALKQRYKVAIKPAANEAPAATGELPR